jgi:PRTRC genetic system protein A
MGQMTQSKQIFPIIEGLPEGGAKSFVTYSVCSNGIFQTRLVCGKGSITTKVEGIKGLPEGKESIDILPRKIPISYFWKIVEFFRHVKETFNEKLEAYILLGYNFDEDKFMLYVPKHSVGAAHVKYDIESFWKDYPGYYLVLDAHLHCDFGAFWSGTDNADDKRDRFSMVIGHQDNPIPDVKLRFANGAKHIDYDLRELFTKETEDIDFDFKKAIKNISYTKPEFVKTNTGYVGRNDVSFYDSLRFRIKQEKQFSLQELFPGW